MDKEQIEKAQKTLSEGGIIIYPTETAYGIAADATNRKAIEKVYEMKQRPREKGITTITKNFEQANKYGKFNEKEEKLIKEFMPGPLTLVTQKNNKNKLPKNLNEQFVFRISSSKLARKLASKKPITATSANISGNETSYKIEDIDNKLLDKADLVIDEGKLEKQPTSTIAEIKNGEITVHREGPISKKDLEDVTE